MDQHKPLSYQSLKTVIQYMDSDFRLFRSRHIASLRKIQKVVPLKLGVLELDNSKLTFDNIDYEYNNCREFRERDGGPVITQLSKYDLNNDGDEERFEDLMPGDIVIKEKDWRGGFPYRDINFINDSYVECFVRTSFNRQYRPRRSHYGVKLRDVMRKRLHQVLGGKGIHQVDYLKIGTDHGVLRLPEGLKLKIRELGIVRNSMAVIDAISPILDVSSFPLKSLSIWLEDPQDPIIQSEILRTSKSLNIYNCQFFNNHCANLVINLPNMKIHLRNYIPLNNIVLIIRHWMEHPRVIGTRLSMQARSVKEYLDTIEKELKAVERVFHERKCFTLPMTSTSELNIYEADSPYDRTWLTLGMKQPCMIVMEVMTIGTAKPSKDQ